MRIYTMLLAAVMAIMVLPGIAQADINAETRAEAIARIQERDPNYGGGAHAGGSHTAASIGMHKGDSAWEEFWVQDIDFRPFMSRLRTVLLEDPGMARCTAQDDIISFLDQMYLFNIGTSHVDMAITGDDIMFNCASTYEGLPADSAPARIYALENLPLESWALVDDGDFMMYMGIQHMPTRMMIQLDEIKRQAELTEGMDGPFSEVFGGMELEELEQTMQLMKAMQIDKIIDSTLSGEVGIALYDMPSIDRLVNGDEVQPTDFVAAVAIGIRDAAYVREMMGTYGSEIGLTPRPDSGANGWDVFDVPMMPGLGIVMNERMVVATTDADFVIGKLMDGGSMSVAPCQAHFALNMAALDGKIVEPGMKLLADEIADGDEEVYWPVDSMKYLWDVPEQDGLGYMTMTAYTGDAMRNEMRMKKAVFQYLMYYMSTMGAGVIQTEMH